MVYCAAFGCNNQAKKGNGLSFFSFPKDSNLRKVWTHYCKRWNFVPGPSHRLCSAHFSKDRFTQDPLRMAELGVQGKFQARLKPDAVPSIPLTVSREVKDGRPVPIQLPMPRRAFEKRRKAEVSNFMHI